MGFKPATSTPKYVKAFVKSFQKRGKTVFCLSLAEILAGKGKVAMIATESPHDFSEEFKFDAWETKSINTAIQAIDEAIEAGYKVLIIDSVTEYYQNLMKVFQVYVEKYGTPYQKANLKKDKISFYDQRIYKKPWNKFVRKVVESPIHMLITSRKTEVYEKNSKGDLEIVGNKAQVQSKFEYEISHVFDLEKNGEGVRSVEYDGRTKGLDPKTILPNYMKLEHSAYIKEFAETFKPLVGKIGKVEPVQIIEKELEQDVESLAEAEISDVGMKIQNLTEYFIEKSDLKKIKAYFESTFSKTLPEILKLDNSEQVEIFEQLKLDGTKKFGDDKIEELLNKE